MKDKVLKIVKQELKMTNTPEYRSELEEILEYAKSLGDSFEDNMSLYKKARSVCSDTSPREQLYLAKEEYIKEVTQE
jgi:7-cyano-7-deazaguanine synthase in queuosine biosynthesis